LNEGNNYTATITYTPTVSGQATITANFDSGIENQTHTFFVRPYSTVIGFIGDSITAGGITPITVAHLGLGVDAINAAVGGTTAISWAANDSGPTNPNTTPNTPLMTNAFTKFDVAGVEIINLMLGTNDAGISTGNYKIAMQSIINQLKQH
jgi:hypothetical protein